MKNIITFLFCFLFSQVAFAQTITVGTVTPLASCLGDEIVVPYTSTGLEGNTFTLQLSDANGSFTDFTNAGSSDLATGTFALVISNPGNHYRVRVASTYPHVVSASNTSDILVTAIPSPLPSDSAWNGRRPTYAQCKCYFEGGMAGDPITLEDDAEEPSGSTFLWSFNEDASPDTSTSATPTVTYPTPGIKDGTLTVTAAGGCSTSANFGFKVLSCDPIIPVDAEIVTNTQTGTDSVVWVQYPGTYTAVGNSQTIFADPGAVVTAGSLSNTANYSTFYLKAGSSFSINSSFAYATVILDTGTVITIGEHGDTIYCSNLTFEQQSASVSAETAPKIIVRQSFDLLSVSGASPISLRILNILGAEVLSQNGTGELDLDLSPLPAGVYFAQVQSGDAREVRKIAVVH